MDIYISVQNKLSRVFFHQSAYAIPTERDLNSSYTLRYKMTLYMQFK